MPVLGGRGAGQLLDRGLGGGVDGDERDAHADHLRADGDDVTAAALRHAASEDGDDNVRRADPDHVRALRQGGGEGDSVDTLALDVLGEGA
ncbi:hypothetical protein [Curtobacterium sp. L1-20]|uniref:hypothetical protein n=1 Tax=Curtobacterium sp. L1-20 TaxID=3138181 RepID=UPI003B522E05